MKALIVNNKTVHLDEIKSSLAGYQIEIQRYSPELVFKSEDKDLIILSGGGAEGEEINDKVTANQFWYQNEMNFVRTCKKPIIGICMGFEVIAKAFGAVLEDVNCYFEDYVPVQATPKGAILFGQKDLSQFEAHHMGIKEASNDFEILATSNAGIEIMKHKNRPIIATQFHPEMPEGTLGLKDLCSILAKA